MENMGVIIAGVIGAVAKKLVEYPVDLLKKPVTYLCCYSSNVNQLRKEVSKLEIEINTVNEMIENAKVESGDIRIPADVQDWRDKVERIKNDSDQIFNEVEQIKKTRLSKWIPFLHWSLSRKAQKTTESAVQRENPKEFKQVAFPLITADLPPPPANSEISLKSRLSLEEEIIDALKKKDAHLIGIHGMGGAGKTTMVENIERKLAEKTQDSSKMFERIVKAVVSQEPDLLKIQKQVAEGLGLKLEDENLSNRAKRLHTSLVNTQSILIIFDDVWDKMDLEHIGIPSQRTHVGCKLLLTSRDLKAITLTADNAMIFHLDNLGDDEAWVLFRKIAGNSIDSPELHHIAKQVCRECKGLPLALKAVGSALNGESEACWQDALVGLQKAMPQNIPNVLEHVYKPLLWSFDKLEREYMDLLLLCCLFEEDSNISLENLVRYGCGLGMFEGMECLSEVRNRVESIVGHLISRSLLLDGIDYLGNLCVKMHDVVRDVGIHMKKHEFLISHGRKEWPKIIKEGSYGNYTCISLTSSGKYASFPECKEYPRLQLLRVAYNGLFRTLKLPNNLFTSTSKSESLKVLEIRRFDSLPSSINMLENLLTLYLFGSTLECVSVIGELRNLEILRLRQCEFEMLPKNIGELKSLKKLDVIDCDRLVRIEYGVVSGLEQLEELVIVGNISLEWGVEEDGQGINDKSCLAELNSLNHLTTLCIEISNSNAIPKEMPLWMHNVNKYSISSLDDAFELMRFQRAIHLGDDTALLGDWFYDHMARNAEYIEFCGISCSNVINKLISSGYQSTIVLKLKLCNNVKYLSRVPFERRQNAPIFPVLKILDIEDSDSLKVICDGAPPAGSFKELEEIYFTNLTKLTYIFPVAVCLPQLQVLEVSSCPAIQEVFKREEGSVEITNNKINLPKLCVLTLNNLPSLHDFSKGIDEVEFPELNKLTLDFPNSMRNDNKDAQHLYLFDQKVESNSIQPWFSLATIKNINCFSGIETLRIGFLNNVKNIFCPSVLSGFAKLRELDVESCLKLENVARETKTNTNLFPQLKRLKLTSLPVLLAVCHNMGIFELPSLERLHITNCPMMETFCKPFSDVSKSEQVTQFFFTEVVSFPNLWDLCLINIKATRIFSENIPIDSFCRLKDLTVKNCERMTNVFSDPNIFRRLTNVVLESCEELEEVIAEKDKNIKITLFPQLRHLELWNLPNIHKFCHHMDKLEFSSLERLKIWDCPMMVTFCTPFSVSSLSKLEQVTPSFFNNEVSFPNLRSLHLINIQATRIFSENIPNIFTRLTNLNLESCRELQEVITEKHKNIKITLFPQLRYLGLRRLPKMHKFCHNKDDLELTSLKVVDIDDCPMLETFSLGSLHLPVFKELKGLSDPNFATKIFFHKEKSSHKSHLDNYCFTISPTDLSFNTEVGWILSPDLSDRSFFSVAVLNFHNSMHMIKGNLETGKLVEGVVYEIILIIQRVSGFGIEKSLLYKLTLHGEVQQHNNERENKRPREKWIEIIVGEFIREPRHIADLEFSISLRSESHLELWIKGIVIRSKGSNE